jgi:CHAT domain-containing protein
VVDTDVVKDVHNTKMVVISSHGGVGFLDYFRTITDQTHSYSSQEFANRLDGCGCVVLFVCSAGRSDPQFNSSETLGLVSALLSQNVRCVVASAWPLEVHIPEKWLPVFLESLSTGSNVADAVFKASKMVRSDLDHPGAWAALQVYGDPAFTV